MTPVSRQTGATLCAVARCPNRLGASPYRYCPEHIPAHYRQRAQQYAETGEERRRIWKPAAESRATAREAALRLICEAEECDRDYLRRMMQAFAENTVDKAIQDLVQQGAIKRVKVGIYRAQS